MSSEMHHISVGWKRPLDGAQGSEKGLKIAAVLFSERVNKEMREINRNGSHHSSA